METARGRSTAQRRLEETTGLVVLVLAVLIVLALASYRAEDSNWFHRAQGQSASRNWTGSVGGTIAEALLQLFGVAALLVPVVLAGIGWNRFRGRSAVRSYGGLIGYAVLIPSLCALLDSLSTGRCCSAASRSLPAGSSGPRARARCVRC